MYIVLVLIFLIVTKHQTKTKFWRKGHIWLTLPEHCLSSKEVIAEVQTEQEPGGGTDAEAIEECCLLVASCVLPSLLS